MVAVSLEMSNLACSTHGSALRVASIEVPHDFAQVAPVTLSMTVLLTATSEEVVESVICGFMS